MIQMVNFRHVQSAKNALYHHKKRILKKTNPTLLNLLTQLNLPNLLKQRTSKILIKKRTRKIALQTKTIIGKKLKNYSATVTGTWNMMETCALVQNHKQSAKMCVVVQALNTVDGTQSCPKHSRSNSTERDYSLLTSRINQSTIIESIDIHIRPIRCTTNMYSEVANILIGNDWIVLVILPLDKIKSIFLLKIFANI